MSAKKNAIEKFDSMLQRHISKKHLVKLCRTFNLTQSDIFGYLLGMSDDLLLVQVQSDFLLDGYAVLPKYAFDSLRYNKYDKALTKILVAEGICEREWGIKNDIDLSGWHEMFACLQQQDVHVIVECEYLKRPQFVIGAIISIEKKSVSILNYNAAGRLDTKPTTIKFKNITSVKFEDHYSKTFRKYLKEPKTKKVKSTGPRL